MATVKLRMDSKGRICIPPEIREEIGETTLLKRTPAGFLIAPGGKGSNFLEDFREAILSALPRTEKPENWSPSRMKAVWR